jgi:hypothetical protein
MQIEAQNLILLKHSVKSIYKTGLLGRFKLNLFSRNTRGIK